MTHTPLTVEEHLSGIDAAAGRMATWAREAGTDAPVPTCPGWSVRELLAHQGMVHRWATAIVGGEDRRGIDTGRFEAEGRAAPDPVAWLRDGVTTLLEALRSAPADLDVFTFLEEAPPAREFWARRQHHETTIHAVDALAARDGRLASAADAWFGDEVALDGVDELLVGFWQRRTRGPRASVGHSYSALVQADSAGRWLLDISEHRVVTRRLGEQGHPPGPVEDTVSGPAVDLYLALWNRGGRVDDPGRLIPRWADGGSIG